MGAKELSLRPYPGRVFVVKTRKEYENAHEEMFGYTDKLSLAQKGRFAGEGGVGGRWTYLVWGNKPHDRAHELAHVVLHVFERCGIDPREGNGEPFCYLLSQLILDSNS